MTCALGGKKGSDRKGGKSILTDSQSGCTRLERIVAQANSRFESALPPKLDLFGATNFDYTKSLDSVSTQSKSESLFVAVTSRETTFQTTTLEISTAEVSIQ